MRLHGLTVAIGLTLASLNVAPSLAAKPSAATATWVQQALSSDRAVASAAIAQLRSQGAAGLEAFLAAHQAELAVTPRPAAAFRTVLDQLCQQRDCYASRLYWFTDWEQAKAAAQASGKPILSLRLLGRLDEDMSCANSRFFRVALYPNAAVAQYLRDRFILHWQSVRPVPKLTIDFGDGRKLERTLTGNSIHYVVTADGTPVDALPGLYGPQAFLRELRPAETVARQVTRLAPPARQTALQTYHRDRLTALQTAWATDLTRLGVAQRPLPVPVLVAGSPSPDAPATPISALLAGEAALTKARVERPILSQTLPPVSGTREPAVIEPAANQGTLWTGLGQLHRADARLDAASQALMRSKHAAYQQPAAFQTALQGFEQWMATDTARNQYELRPQLHQWLSTAPTPPTLEQLNQRVYTQLFLTPNSDPWLGLRPEDAYSAIEADGLVP